MTSDWVLGTLGEVCRSVFSGGTPTSTNPDYYGGSIPWLRTKEVNYTKIYETEVCISQAGFDASSAKLVPINSVIVAMYGNGDTAGRVAINKVPLTTNQACCNLVIDGSKADYRFVYYYLKARYQKLVDLKNGGAQQNLNGRLIKDFPIAVPALATQVEIGDFLEALDDRIALLRETNATLEAIAQALFKSWFVDFDPVRAKQQGLAPAGMNEATAALFPDSFEESALGWVPKGWGVGSILDVATLLSGGTPKTDRPEFWGGGIRWASAKDVSQSTGSVLVSTERTITQEGLARSATRLIPALATAVVARGATTGRMVLLGAEMAMNQTCYALTSKHNAPVALYCLLRKEIDALVNAAHGSVFDTITTKTFDRSTVIHPRLDLLDRFEQIARPIVDKIVEATSMAQTLATLRDTLLPRLISGQLRLPEAGALIVEAT